MSTYSYFKTWSQTSFQRRNKTPSCHGFSLHCSQSLRLLWLEFMRRSIKLEVLEDRQNKDNKIWRVSFLDSCLLALATGLAICFRGLLAFAFSVFAGFQSFRHAHKQTEADYLLFYNNNHSY
jgi:hypothetical protein